MEPERRQEVETEIDRGAESFLFTLTTWIVAMVIVVSVLLFANNLSI